VATDEFPVQLTERSAAAIRQILRGNPEIPGTVYIRVSFENGSPGFNLVAGVDPATDLIGESFGFKVAVPRHDCSALAGYVIDHRSIGSDTGFVLKDPRSLHSRASDPGQLLLSEDKLRRLQPDLFSSEPGFFGRVLGRRLDPGLQEFREGLAEHLLRGDSRAAVVVSITPLVVAAYTDELDCVALLKFPDYLVSEHRLQVGSRLLTVNLYHRAASGERPRDLVPGPKDTRQFTNYTPLIADFLATNADRVDRRKQAISDDEWARTTEMGEEQWGRGVRPRDGLPLHCGRPS
jgi:Fe-S cluster assembly iron-binding protein IscA